MLYKAKDINALLTKVEAASDNIAEWNTIHDKFSSTLATLIFSMGELIQPDSAYFGALWAWDLQGKIKLVSKSHVPGLVRQLENVIEVEVTLMEALLFASQLPDHGCVIEVS